MVRTSVMRGGLLLVCTAALAGCLGTGIGNTGAFTAGSSGSTGNVGTGTGGTATNATATNGSATFGTVGTGTTTGGFQDGTASSSTGGIFNVDGGAPLLTTALTGRGSADGTLGQSVDGSLLYVASADDSTLVVVDPTGAACPTVVQPNACIVATLAVGTDPARVLVGADDTIYVSNRKSRSISVIHPPAAGGSWSVSSTLSTGAEPLGMALAPSGGSPILYVANHGSGTVEAFNVATSAVLWTTTVGDFPRSVAALADGELYVSHYRSGMVDILDSTTGTLVKSVSANVGAVPALTAATTIAGAVVQPTFSSVAMDSLVVSPDGARVYMAHRRERSGIISDVSFPPIVAPAITTFETSTDLPHDDALETSQSYPPTIIYPENRISFINQGADGGFVNPGSGADGGSGAGYGGIVAGFGWSQGPVAMVEDQQGEYLFVANENSADITILPASRRSGSDAPGGIAAVVPIDEGPSGIAISPNNLTIYVYNAIGHSISVIVNSFGTPTEFERLENVGSNGALGSDAVTGRDLFYSASNSAMAAPGSGVACESCHLEGGTDGHVWQFIWGPRKTMGLLDKDIAATDPYHWDGTELQMSNLLDDTITVRMGGSGIDTTQQDQISTFLSGLLPADNPNQLAGGLNASQANGQALFNSNCASCHSGAEMTDNGFHSVGTLVTTNPNGNPDDLCRLGVGYTGGTCLTDTPALPSVPNPNNNGGFNTPTVLGLYFAPPYFHDGSSTTLTDVVQRSLTGAGLPALSASDTSDLVNYLETL